MRLPVRLTLVGVTTLAATLVVVGFGTYELVRASGREEVDRALRRELAALTAGFPPLVAETGSLSAEALGRAARRYLAANPGSDRHLTVISFGTDEWATRDGPASLVELRREGELPAGRLGVLTTVDTAEGPVRLLVAPLEAGGTEVG
ncbi:MAG: hypothetical protein ACRDY7_10830, partial [Acidimicrobiia bacterium]